MTLSSIVPGTARLINLLNDKQEGGGDRISQYHIMNIIIVGKRYRNNDGTVNEVVFSIDEVDDDVMMILHTRRVPHQRWH